MLHPTIKRIKNLLTICLFPLFIFAYGYAVASSCERKAVAEFWAEKDLKIGGIDVTYTICPSWFSEIRGGVSYYADKEFLYQGIASSARFKYGEVISPYIGLGLLAGSAEKTVDASADGIDNNKNGVIDESDETKTLKQLSGFIYPEVGVALYAGSLGITLSARRYYGSAFSGNLIYSLGIVFEL